mmetsp:Transcript_8496/g.23891  ORF Transcript_8496/g.23891 Transcript_8496/m.23891 type:complete len:149 (+) Transcript_8496:450-896(+)
MNTERGLSQALSLTLFLRTLFAVKVDSAVDSERLLRSLAHLELSPLLLLSLLRSFAWPLLPPCGERCESELTSRMAWESSDSNSSVLPELCKDPDESASRPAETSPEDDDAEARGALGAEPGESSPDSREVHDAGLGGAWSVVIAREA